MSDEVSIADQGTDAGSVTRDGWTPPALTSIAAAEAAPVIDVAREAEQAREQGYAEGRAEGLAAARAQSEDVAQQMNALLASLASAYADTDSVLLRDLLDLTSRVARAVLRRELATDSDTIESVIREALALLADAPATTELTLHPLDAQRARDLGLLEDQVIIRESQRIQRGGAQLRNGNTLLDASVEARLQAVLDALYLDAGLPVPTVSADNSLNGNA
ncbi:MAG: FliH/SctL family protein [Congregibacter sp.]